ncbi:hypothetical protein BH18ACT5_BH18ACT5_03700 [soil metagenome]
MSKPRLISIALLAVVGLVFIGQGVGLIGGSLMTDQPIWAAIGSVMVGVALALAVRHGANR